MDQKKQAVKKSGIKSKKTLIFGIIISIFLASLLGIWCYKSCKPQTPKVKKLNNQEIFTDFSLNSFNSDIEAKLLTELRICDTSRIGDEFGACSPKFFKFFKLSKKKPLRDGFMLLINGIAFQDPDAKFPIRRLLIFEREGGKLVAVNKFKGNLIETREVLNSPYSDIIIRFRLDQFNEKYHVRYSWKKNKYQFVACEKLVYWDEDKMKFVGGRVLASKMDSVSREVEKILVDENLIF